MAALDAFGRLRVAGCFVIIIYQSKSYPNK